MASILVHCGDVNWQSDFEPLVPRLYRYFAVVFRHHHDREEMRHRAVLQCMRRVRGSWKPNKVIGFNTRWVRNDVLAGRDILQRPPRPQIRCEALPLRSCLKIRHHGTDKVLEEVHTREVLERLEERPRRAAEMILAGHCINDVREALRMQHGDVKRAVRIAVRMLQA
jgi:hypothetical protein